MMQLLPLNDRFRACSDAFATNQAEKDRQERYVEENQRWSNWDGLKRQIAEATAQRDAAEAACGEATAALQQLRPRLRFWQPGEQLPEV